MVERFFRDLTSLRVRAGIFKSVAELESAIGDYLRHHNARPKPFIWTAKAADILAKVTRARAALLKAQNLRRTTLAGGAAALPRQTRTFP